MHISDFVNNWYHALMIKNQSNHVFIATGTKAMHYFTFFIAFLSELEAGSNKGNYFAV